MNRQFKTTDGIPGGFVTDIEGFLCFIQPVIDHGQIRYQWIIQEGGGWTYRGGEHVVERAVGTTYSSISAEKAIESRIEELLVEAGEI